MRTWKWMVTAFLLAGFSAMAQTAGQSSSAPTSAPQQAAPQASQSADPAAAQNSASSAPTTLNQVVDRAIAREHALVTMLADRTPLVETYLQNMKYDPQLGPMPTEDHYFFGRMDHERYRRPAGLSEQGKEFPRPPDGRHYQVLQVRL